MADVPHAPDVDADSATGRGAAPEHEAYPGTPRWVIVFGAIALAVVILVVALHLTGLAPGAALHHGMPQR